MHTDAESENEYHGDSGPSNVADTRMQGTPRLADGHAGFVTITGYHLLNCGSFVKKSKWLLFIILASACSSPESSPTAPTSTAAPSGTASAAATRILALSGDVAFGSVNVGATGNQTLTLSNTGNAALTWTNLVFTNASGSVFTRDTTAGVIAAGRSQTVTLTFAPVEARSYSTTLTVTSDATSGTSTAAVTALSASVARPPMLPSTAAVYRGPGACTGCAEALATLLQQAGFATRFVGPEDLSRDATFEGISLYAQPGGDDTMSVYRAIGPQRWPAVVTRIQRFVRGGGHYLGVCLGGFLAARWMDDPETIPALQLVSGTADYYTQTPRPYRQDQVIPVFWLSPPATRFVYFQEGPTFNVPGATILARYENGTPAVLVTPYGAGRVGLSGVHLEAPSDWYASYQLNDPDGPDGDLGLKLIGALSTDR